MAGSKQVSGVLLAGIFLWVGLGLLGPQVPLAGERQPQATAAGGIRQAKSVAPRWIGGPSLPGGAADNDSVCGPGGRIGEEGRPLGRAGCLGFRGQEDTASLPTRKAEADWILARESQSFEKRTANGQIDLAAKALRLAQNQLKAYTEGEYVDQLAMAEAARKIAGEKRVMAEVRVARLQATLKPDDTPGTATMTTFQEAQMALQEASVQSAAAENALTMLKTFGHDNKVAELELAVAQREFDLARAQDALSAATARSGALLQLAETTRDMEADRLAKLDDQIVKGKIYAPRDGMVVYPDDAGEAVINQGPLSAPVKPSSVFCLRQQRPLNRESVLRTNNGSSIAEDAGARREHTSSHFRREPVGCAHTSRFSRRRSGFS